MRSSGLTRGRSGEGGADLNRQDSSHWDEIYASGDFRQKWHREKPSRELTTAVCLGLVPAGGCVLDIGCGAGTEAIYLGQRGFVSIGVDFSPEAIRIAQERARQAGVAVEFRVGNALDLPVEAASVDVVFDRGCFHQIPEESRGRYAAEVARVLKPGGRLFLRGHGDDGSGTFVPIDDVAMERHFGPPVFESRPVEVLEDADEEDPRIFVGVLITKALEREPQA